MSLFVRLPFPPSLATRVWGVFFSFCCVKKSDQVGLFHATPLTPKRIPFSGAFSTSRAAVQNVAARCSPCALAVCAISTHWEPSVVGRWSVGDGLFTPSLLCIHTSGPLRIIRTENSTPDHAPDPPDPSPYAISPSHARMWQHLRGA